MFASKRSVVFLAMPDLWGIIFFNGDYFHFSGMKVCFNGAVGFYNALTVIRARSRIRSHLRAYEISRRCRN